MKIAKIKNSYMYNGDNPNGSHYYAVYYHKPTKRYRAIQLTHLYVRDSMRQSKVDDGTFIKEKFSLFETPSCVRNEYYDCNAGGRKINLSDRANVVYVSPTNLSNAQANRILAHGGRRRKR